MEEFVSLAGWVQRRGRRRGRTRRVRVLALALALALAFRVVLQVSFPSEFTMKS